MALLLLDIAACDKVDQAHMGDAVAWQPAGVFEVEFSDDLSPRTGLRGQIDVESVADC